MTATVFPDTEGAMRTFLRAAPSLGGRRVEFGIPSGSAECIVIHDAGGAPDPNVPLENSLMSFSCWASHDAATRKSGTKADARAIRDLLVGVLFDLGTNGAVNVTVNSRTVRLLGATVVSALWLPDLSTTPDTPRYVVDALVHAIAL